MFVRRMIELGFLLGLGVLLWIPALRADTALLGIRRLLV